MLFNLGYFIIIFISAISLLGIFLIPGFSAGYMLTLSRHIRYKENLNFITILKHGWKYWFENLIYLSIVVSGLIISAVIIYVALVYIFNVTYMLLMILIGLPLLIIFLLLAMGIYFIVPSFMIVDKDANPLNVYKSGIKLIGSVSHLSKIVIS